MPVPVFPAIAFLPFVPVAMVHGKGLILRCGARTICRFSDEICEACRAFQRANPNWPKMPFRERLAAFEAGLGRPLLPDELANLVQKGKRQLPLSPPTNRFHLKQAMGAAPSDMIAAHAHHELPFEFVEEFAKLGLDVNDPQYGKWAEDVFHRAVHARYNDMYEAYNSAWARWLRNTRSELITKESALAKLAELRGQYGQYYHP